MARFGYKLMTEEHGPAALIENARKAEQAGFDFVAISDHFHPWLKSHGHSPFAWSVLGGIAAQTSKVGIMTAVTCPILRYHPAIIAQAAATIAVMSNERFTLGLGAGERLNEHVVGAGWPAAPIRHEMLTEAIDICSLLWQGGTQSFFGKHFQVESARVYDLPRRRPPIALAISGPKAAALAASKAQAIVTTGADPKLIDLWKEHGGGAGPRYVELGLCYAATEEEGLRIAHERFRFGQLGWKVLPELPNVGNFEEASSFIRMEDMRESMPCGPDASRHLAAIKRALDAGFDHIILLQPGTGQDGFFRFWQEQLQPALKMLPA